MLTFTVKHDNIMTNSREGVGVMYCKSCGNPINDDALVCSFCGTAISETNHEEQTKTAFEQEGIGDNVMNAHTEDSNEPVPGVQEEYQLNMESEITFISEENASVSCVVEQGNEESKKKRPFYLKKAVIIPVVVILAILLAFPIYPYAKNAVMKLFLSSEKYFAYVVKTNADDVIDNFSTSLSTSKKYMVEGGGGESEFTMKKGAGLEELLSDLDVDDVSDAIEWFDSVGLSVSTNAKDDVSKATLGANLNGVELGNIDVITDLGEMMFYMCLPDYNPKYIGADLEEASSFDFNNYDFSEDSDASEITLDEYGNMVDAEGNIILAYDEFDHSSDYDYDYEDYDSYDYEDYDYTYDDYDSYDYEEYDDYDNDYYYDSGFGSYYDFEAYQESMEIVKDVMNALPNEVTTQKLLKKYLETVVDSVEFVEEDKTTIEADGISQKVTRLTIDLDGEVIKNASLAVLEAIKEDEDIAEIVESIASAVDADEDDFWDGLDSLLEEVEDMDEDEFDVDVTFELFVNGKGESVGFTLEIDDATIEAYTAEKWNKYGTLLKLKAGYVKGSIEGSGKKHGNKYSGLFKLKVMGNDIADFELKDIDNEKLKKGIFYGSVTIKCAEDVEDLLEYADIEDEYADVISRLAIIIRSSSKSAEEGDCSISVEYQEEPCVDFALKAKTVDQKKIDIPKDYLDAIDVDEVKEWVEEFDVEILIDRLREAGVPDDIVDSMEDNLL